MLVGRNLELCAVKCGKNMLRFVTQTARNDVAVDIQADFIKVQVNAKFPGFRQKGQGKAKRGNDLAAKNSLCLRGFLCST